jgi:hypothetical protein
MALENSLLMCNISCVVFGTLPFVAGRHIIIRICVSLLMDFVIPCTIVFSMAGSCGFSRDRALVFLCIEPA